MKKDKSGKIGFIIFLIFIIGLILGGQYLYDKTLKHDIRNKENNNSNTSNVDYRIDKTKEYFYFTNEEVISEQAEIYYKDIVINIKDQVHIANSLNSENKIYKENIKYIKDQEMLLEEMINYNNDGLYMLEYREYETYKYENYVSLVVKDYLYDCFDQSTIKNIKSYVFDINTGKLLTNEDIFEKFNTNIDNIKDNIRTKLTEKQEIVEEVELIKIDDTLNSFENYGTYVNDVGNLVVTYLVKSSQIDYNDSITID